MLTLCYYTLLFIVAKNKAFDYTAASMNFKEMEIHFSRHALEQMEQRGILKEEIIETVRNGEHSIAKKGRNAFRKNFAFEKNWGKKFYMVKQVMPIAIEEHNRLIVVTAYAFYF